MPRQRLPRRLVSRGGGGGYNFPEMFDQVTRVLAIFSLMECANYVFNAFQSRPLEHNSLVANRAASAMPTIPNNFGGNNECSLLFKAFQECLERSGNDIRRCQFLMNTLADCRRNTGC